MSNVIQIAHRLKQASADRHKELMAAKLALASEFQPQSKVVWDAEDGKNFGDGIVIAVNGHGDNIVLSVITGDMQTVKVRAEWVNEKILPKGL